MSELSDLELEQGFADLQALIASSLILGRDPLPPEALLARGFPGLTPADRSRNAKRQLRDRFGRFVEMGGHLRWKDRSGAQRPGRFLGIDKGGRVLVGDPEAGTIHAVDPKDVQAIDAKATIGGPAKQRFDLDGDQTVTAGQARAALKGVKPEPEPVAREAARPAPRSDQERRAATERVALDIAARAQNIEPSVTPLVQSAVERSGGRMDGLDDRLKEQQRIAEKLNKWEREDGDRAESQTNSFPDALRYTAVLPEESYAATIRRMLADLASQGHGPVRFANYWSDDQDYSGVNVNMVGPNGEPWELQFHTEVSLARKKRSHALYQIARNPDVPIAQRRQALAQMKGIWQSVPQPAGWDELGNLVTKNPAFDIEAVEEAIRRAGRSQDPIKVRGKR